MENIVSGHVATPPAWHPEDRGEEERHSREREIPPEISKNDN
jgi:hypothetical protein